MTIMASVGGVTVDENSALLSSLSLHRKSLISPCFTAQILCKYATSSYVAKATNLAIENQLTARINDDQADVRFYSTSLSEPRPIRHLMSQLPALTSAEGMPVLRRRDEVQVLLREPVCAASTRSISSMTGLDLDNAL